MATALDVIKRSLRMIGELAAETGEAPSAAASEHALASLNAMLASWENRGVRLAMPTLALTTTVPVPASHDDAIAFNLAVSLATEWGMDVPAAIGSRAASEFATLQAVHGYQGQMTAPIEYVYTGGRRW